MNHLGWKTFLAATIICAAVFHIYDNVALESPVYAVIASVFLGLAIICAIVALRKLWILSGEKEGRRHPTPGVIRQAVPRKGKRIG